MADFVWLPMTKASATVSAKATVRHSALVRVTHWLTTLCFVALLVTGIEILISHPRFYWGESGNIHTPALFQIPVPASRSSVPTGYGYVLPDQNGWSRYLHFEAAWGLVLTGIVYLAAGLFTGHFRRNLLPTYLSWSSVKTSLGEHFRLVVKSNKTYNPLQRVTYSLVVFVLFPLIIWTGLAMSPAIASGFPAAVSLLGGQQSARTIHFFVTVALVLFLLTHIGMVCLSGFKRNMRAMITGRDISIRHTSSKEPA